MLGKLFLLFTIVSTVELLLLIWLGDVVGFGGTVGIILLTALVGASLAKWQGLRIYRRIQGELQGGRIPGDDLLNGLLVLIAGAVLLTPGVLTDTAGFLLLLPPTRAPVRRMLRARLARAIKAGTIRVTEHARGGFGGGATRVPKEVIEIEPEPN